MVGTENRFHTLVTFSPIDRYRSKAPRTSFTGGAITLFHGGIDPLAIPTSGIGEELHGATNYTIGTLIGIQILLTTVHRRCLHVARCGSRWPHTLSLRLSRRRHTTASGGVRRELRVRYLALHGELLAADIFHNQAAVCEELW